MTGELQPLDRSCFSALKMMSQQLWDEKIEAHPELAWSHRESARFLEQAWAGLRTRAILRGWNLRADADSQSAGGETDGGTKGERDSESDEMDFAFHKEQVSEASEPPSDGTWTDLVRRVQLVQSRHGPVREVGHIRASLHDMPTGPTREEFKEEQREELERKGLQRETEQWIETSFLFSQQAYARVKPVLDRDGFLFPR
jgi:hypothetical protein